MDWSTSIARGGVEGAVAGAIVIGGLALAFDSQILVWTGVGAYLGSLGGTLAALSREASLSPGASQGDGDLPMGLYTPDRQPLAALIAGKLHQ